MILKEFKEVIEDIENTNLGYSDAMVILCPDEKGLLKEVSCLAVCAATERVNNVEGYSSMAIVIVPCDSALKAELTKLELQSSLTFVN